MATSRIDKIDNLIQTLGEVQESIEEFEYDLQVCDRDIDQVEYGRVCRKEGRLIQKLRKQMSKFLEETNE